MIDKDKTYRTRDGRAVRIYATDGIEPEVVHGAIKFSEGWDPRTWQSSGRFYDLDIHDDDLIEVKPRIKRTVWVDLYPNDVNWFSGENYAIGKTCLARVKMEIDCEEGEGL